MEAETETPQGPENSKLTHYAQPVAIIVGLLVVLFIGSYIATISDTEPIHTISVAEAVGEPPLYTVLAIFDGDTLLVSIDGKAEKVRLLGVDTPEVENPYTREECFGQEASAFTKELVTDSRVALVSDSLNDNRDKFDRLLRYVVLENGVPLNEQLLDRGYARMYNGTSFDRMDLFKKLESRAKDSNRGLWNACTSGI